MIAPPPTPFGVNSAPRCSDDAGGIVDPERAGGRGAEERLTATPAGVALGRLEQIADGAGRNFVLQLRAGRFHGFVVRRGDDVFGYVDRCPHMGLPLAQVLDDYVAGDRIACSWHGALFRIEDGACLGGPCPGTRLTPWPVAVVDGIVTTR